MRRSLNDVLTMLEQQIGNRDIQIQFLCNSKVPDLIYSDVKRIKQVLYQLVSNSINYTQRGYIKVTASITDSLPIEESPKLKNQSEADEEEEINHQKRNSEIKSPLILEDLKV